MQNMLLRIKANVSPMQLHRKHTIRTRGMHPEMDNIKAIKK